MVQVRKKQLKKIIQKEYINILKEAKKNEAYFNQIAYEYVIHNLIKEGKLNEQNWPPAESTAGYGGFSQGPNVEVVPEEGVRDVLSTTSSGEFPEHLASKLATIAQKAPSGPFRDKIVDIGHDIYSKLANEIGSIKPQNQIGQLVIEILDTVLSSMSTGRRWTPQEEGEELTV